MPADRDPTQPGRDDIDGYEEIVRELYRGILKREPDDTYLKQRAQKLRAEGMQGGLADAITDLLGTPEYQRRGDAAPSLLVNSSREYLLRLNKEFASKIPPGSLVLDVGAGSSPYRQLFEHVRYESADFKKVDKPYGETTYVCDITDHIPVEDGRFGYILFNQTLEHLKEPAKALSELHRILAPGGALLCTAPLFYEPHELPYDFYRYTIFAHHHLFKQAGFIVEKTDWLEGFFGTCGYMLECIYRDVPQALPNEQHPNSAWAKAFLAAFRPLALIAAGAFYRMDLIWKVTDRGFPKNYVVFAKKPADTAPLKPAAATFEAMSQKVQSMHLTYLGNDKLGSMDQCIRTVKQQAVPGDFLEFGVALGGSGICIASALDDGRSYIGLDVFGMIPPPTDEDGPIPKGRYEIIRSGQSEGIGGQQYYGYRPDLKGEVVRNFEACGIHVDGRRIRFVEGLYQVTIPTLPDTVIAFCHIDCDWYEPVLLCLQYVVPRLSAGGIIVLDDYNDWPGCKRAVDEFCRSDPSVALSRSQPHAVLVKLPLG